MWASEPGEGQAAVADDDPIGQTLKMRRTIPQLCINFPGFSSLILSYSTTSCIRVPFAIRFALILLLP
jgi:hypothetical protein